jgi:alpha-beta hydrolase superfamily lysophospholipase
VEVQARLIDVSVPPTAAGVVLVLHGGANRRDDPRVSAAQLSVLRMIPIARRIARLGRGRVAVLRLLNSHRGWDTTHTPVADVRWALEEIAGRFGDLPVSLVGHSLGGRAALGSLGQERVRSAVALAPWLAESEPLPEVSETQVLIIHGDQDRIASPKRSAEFSQRLGRITPVSYVVVAGGRHSMLRHHNRFSRPAAEFAVATLTAPDPALTSAR